MDSLFADKEVTQLRADCLAERGWDVTVQDGAIIANLPPEQHDAYRADDDACLREAGVDPDAGLTDGQYQTIYSWYTEIDDCLSSHGWDTPQKPSSAEFRDTYDSQPWIPWSLVPDIELQKAHEMCPVMDVPTG